MTDVRVGSERMSGEHVWWVFDSSAKSFRPSSNIWLGKQTGPHGLSSQCKSPKVQTRLRFQEVDGHEQHDKVTTNKNAVHKLVVVHLSNHTCPSVHHAADSGRIVHRCSDGACVPSCTVPVAPHSSICCVAAPAERAVVPRLSTPGTLGDSCLGRSE